MKANASILIYLGIGILILLFAILLSVSPLKEEKQESFQIQHVQPSLLDEAIQKREKVSHHCSPHSMLVSPGGTLFIADEIGCQIFLLDTHSMKVIHTIPLPAAPTGLALSTDAKTLFATCDGTPDTLLFIDTQTLTIKQSFPSNAGSCSPVVSKDHRIFVANQFMNEISVFDEKTGSQIQAFYAGREPSAIALSPDDTLLVVANHLPEGASNFYSTETGYLENNIKGASVRIFTTADVSNCKTLYLQQGSQSLKDVCISPDGHYAFVTHIQSYFRVPTVEVRQGKINRNALSIIDLQSRQIVNTVLLDYFSQGAGNPWGMTCSEDGETLYVTHAGTHEISVIQIAELIDYIQNLPEQGTPYMPEYNSPRSFTYGGYGKDLSQENVNKNLLLMERFRKRIALQGLGPRAILAINHSLVTSAYFSGSVEFIDFSIPSNPKSISIPLGTKENVEDERWGEFLFHDASLCFQGWHSCASCHPDARSDGLNWDLLNDGEGNFKNTKSLVLSHKTPPVMSTGVRANAEIAVRSGLKHIFFTQRLEEEAQAIDAYLQSIQPLSGKDRLDKPGQFAAQRGERLFHSEKTGCSTCHSGPYFTDLQKYDVGTRDAMDQHDEFDTPTLIELWRTGPYLHDGRAESLKDVVLQNKNNAHGSTSDLSLDEINDLVAYMESL